MQLFKKLKKFKTKKIFFLFIAFLKITSIFEHFAKNEPHSLSSYKVIDFKRRANLNTSKFFLV